MTSPVSVNQKKDFIRWFLNYYQLKRKECVWILNYVVNNDEILQRIHFVQQAKHCPNGLVMSTSHFADEVPLKYYKNGVVTINPQEAFQDIHNHNEDIYIQLNFLASDRYPQYTSILEENPFDPEAAQISDKDRAIADKVLNDSIKKFHIKNLLKQIDEALDKYDKDAFQLLTTKLKNLTA